MGGGVGGVLLQESCATPLVPTTNWIFQENLRNCTYFFYIEIIFKGFKFPQILVLFTILVLMEILVLKFVQRNVIHTELPICNYWEELFICPVFCTFLLFASPKPLGYILKFKF